MSASLHQSFPVDCDMTGAMFMPECLRQEGVAKVFGQCGHTNYAFIDACHKLGIESELVEEPSDLSGALRNAISKDVMVLLEVRTRAMCRCRAQDIGISPISYASETGSLRIKSR